MAPPANVPDFLSGPLGGDYPKELHNQLKRTRFCTLSIGDNKEYIHVSMRVRLDSQQPCLDVQFGKVHVVFPATRTKMKLVIKGDSSQYDSFIQARQRDAVRELKKDYQVCLFELSLSDNPVFAGPSWELEGEQLASWNKLKAIQWAGKQAYIWTTFPNNCLGDFCKIQTHMDKLVALVRKNLGADSKMPSFWYAEQNPLPALAMAPRRPMMPWLFDANNQYQAWETTFDFFLDEQDHRSRLVEATIVEQHVQWTTYNDIFCEGKTHDVILEHAVPNEAYWKLHIWMNADPKPAPPETIEAKFQVNVASSPEDLNLVGGTGTCISSSRADFAILTRVPFNPALDGKATKIMATLTVNLKSTSLQLDALEVAGRTVTFGDNPKEKGHGFSLKRTILAQGTELSRTSPFYFELNVEDVSPLEPDIQKQRIDYIRKKYELDKSQHQAVERSVFKVVAGIHLVKGPPGNGKTRTTLVMLLILASLEMRVLISAGSNQAVDTLLLAFHEAVKRDQRLARWCGSYCRFRTPGYQMAVLRRASKARSFQGPTDNSSAEGALAGCQIEAMVVKVAEENYEQQPEAKKLIDLLDLDRRSVLSRDNMTALKRCYESVLRKVISQCKVVAATLNASGDENLKGYFAPYALLCDEAGQCLESDSMIPLTGYLTLRTVVLIGDPDQLPPTVVSSRENEGADFLGRSLMTRLSGYYPLSLLAVNYRCHPDILDWPATAVYKSRITASAGNTKAERVGNAWDTFTASLYHFQAKGLVGKRRIVIDADGVAVQPNGSTSWRNDAHITVVITLLKALYADRSSNDRIVPEDVILICPYKAQVKRAIERFADAGVKYNRCVTIDGLQGQESNVIIFMFTKPHTNATPDVGFVAHYQRLNVALTRAKKLLVVIANLRIWNQKFISRAKQGSGRYLASFLQDAMDKGDVLPWVGQETVERLVDPAQQKRSSLSSVFPPSSPVAKKVSRPSPASHRRLSLQKREAELAHERKQVDLRDAALASRIRAHREELADLDARRARLMAEGQALKAEEAELVTVKSNLVKEMAELSKDIAALGLEEDRASKKAT